jgi:hypothetical protein
MNHEDIRARDHFLARALSVSGHRVINGDGKSGLWVRNAGVAKPPFVDERGLISHAAAKLLFQEEETTI